VLVSSGWVRHPLDVLQCVAVCCSVLQCVAVYCNMLCVLQCVAVRCSVRCSVWTDGHLKDSKKLLKCACVYVSIHTPWIPRSFSSSMRVTLQHTATHCNTHGFQEAFRAVCVYLYLQMCMCACVPVYVCKCANVHVCLCLSTPHGFQEAFRAE